MELCKASLEMKIGAKSKRIQKPKVVHKRNYPFETRKRVVELRYGQYGRPGPAYMEVPKICKILHLKLQTVYTILRTYRKDGYQIKKNPKAKDKKEFFDAN